MKPVRRGHKEASERSDYEIHSTPNYPCGVFGHRGINPPIITLWPRRSGVHDARRSHFRCAIEDIEEDTIEDQDNMHNNKQY